MKRLTKIQHVAWTALSFSLCLCQGQQPPELAPQAFPGGVDAEARGAELSSPLGVRQQRVKRMMVDLEKKFTELSAKLSEEAPDQAEKLEEAFKQSKELLLMQRMDKITRLLNDTKLESANDEQQQIIGDLKSLIDLLLYEESEEERLQREIEKLERWKASLDNLIKEESKLQQESETLDDPEKAKEVVQAKLSDAKDLIKAQEKILEATNANDGKDVDALDKLADEQAELRKATEELAETLSPESEENALAEDASEQAAQAMKQAAKSQRGSEKQLANGKPKDAGKSQESALAQLKKAAEALEKESERLDQLGEQSEKEVASQQEATSEKTGELGDEMSKDAESQEGESSESSPQESVQNAQQQMDQASQQLSQSQPGKASQNQQKAVEELEKAREEVERQLNEKRDEAQQEQIAQLEEAFKKMLQRQQLISASTRELAEKRGGDDKALKRRDRIVLRDLAKDERGVEADAKAAENLLLDDGTSVVFRDIVGYLQQEIANVSELMERRQTGVLVQSAHFEIETTLKELIAALENSGAGEQQQQPPGEQQPGQQQQQRQSLFPPIAELKLLKFTQERINRRTTSIEKAQADPALEEVLDRQLDGVSSMQDKLTNMARQLAAKLQKPSPLGGNESID